jgi:hypothetical protein
VENVPHLLRLCRYVHDNPVEDGLVPNPENRPYSNCLEWMNERPGSLIGHGFVCEHFPSPASCRRFVLHYLRDLRTRF